MPFSTQAEKITDMYIVSVHEISQPPYGVICSMTYEVPIVHTGAGAHDLQFNVTNKQHTNKTYLAFNHSNAKATFVQRTRMQRFFKKPS